MNLFHTDTSLHCLSQNVIYLLTSKACGISIWAKREGRPDTGWLATATTLNININFYTIILLCFNKIPYLYVSIPVLKLVNCKDIRLHQDAS